MPVWFVWHNLYTRKINLKVTRNLASMQKTWFLPRDAMLVRYMLWPSVSVCVYVSVCVCLLQFGVLLKWLNVGTCRRRHTIAHGLFFSFSAAKDRLVKLNGVTPKGGAKCKWVGWSWRKRYNIYAKSLLKTSKMSYALYRMVKLPMPMTLSDS